MASEYLGVGLYVLHNFLYEKSLKWTTQIIMISFIHLKPGAPARGGQGGQAPPWKKIGWALPTLEICLTDHFDGYCPLPIQM